MQVLFRLKKTKAENSLRNHQGSGEAGLGTTALVMQFKDCWLSGESPVVRGMIRSRVSTDRKPSLCWEQGLLPQQRTPRLEI